MNDFNINLQLFAGEEEEDYSLGLDSVETATPSAELEIATEPEETTPPQVEPTEPVQTETPKVKLKYNHEEKEYSLDDVVPLAQKGLNYDKLQEKLEGFEKSPALAYVEKLAKANNMTVDQLVTAWQQADEQAEIQALADKENVPYEIAERLHKVEKETNQIKTTLQTEQQTKAEQEKQQKEFSEFLEAYPDIKSDSVPKEVWEYREKTGKSLTDAMMWHENQTMKNELKILKQNQENKQKAPVGSVTAHGSQEVAGDDDFLKGLLGG